MLGLELADLRLELGINQFDTLGLIHDQMTHVKNATWQEFQDKCTHHIQMYEGGYVDQLKLWVRKKIEPELWAVYEKKYAWNEIDNVMFDVIQKTTKLYNKPSTRAFTIPIQPDSSESTGGSTSFDDDPIYADILNQNLGFDFDQKMNDALKLALICGGSIIRPFIVYDSNGNLENKIRIQILTPDQVIVRCDIHDKYRLTGIEYNIYDYGAANDIIVYRYLWDSVGDWITRATGGKVTDYGTVCFQGNEIILSKTFVGKDYPYYDIVGNPKLPFTPIRPYAPPDQLFNEYLGNDLYDGTLRVGWMDLQEEWLLRHQSHIQLVLQGPNVDSIGNARLDATMPIVLPKGVKDEYSVSVLDIRNDPESIQVTKDKIYERLLTRRGYSLEELKMTSQRQSAEAQRIQQRGRDDYTKELVSIMRYPEELFSGDIRLIWNTHFKDSGVINEDAIFYIDFGNPYDPDAYANWDVKKEWIQMNILSPVDVVLENDPDIKSREEALITMERNRNESKKVKSIGGILQSISSNIPPPTPGAETDEKPPMLETPIQRGLENIGVTLS